MAKQRIAVTGAQGVGKTTLARDLYAICRSRTSVECDFLQGIGQRVRDSGYPMGSTATTETIFAFAAEHLSRERTALAELVIQDRCFLDLLAYERVLGLLREPACRMLRELALTSLQAIDQIYFVPMCDALRNKGSILEPPEFRAQIDATIPIIASEMGIEIVAIVGEPDERAARAFGLLTTAAHGIRFDLP